MIHRLTTPDKDIFVQPTQVVLIEEDPEDSDQSIVTLSTGRQETVEMEAEELAEELNTAQEDQRLWYVLFSYEVDGQRHTFERCIIPADDADDADSICDKIADYLECLFPILDAGDGKMMTPKQLELKVEFDIIPWGRHISVLKTKGIKYRDVSDEFDVDDWEEAQEKLKEDDEEELPEETEEEEEEEEKEVVVRSGK